MKTIILHPSNKRLKQLIKEFGNEWVVINEEESVQCLDNQAGILVAPPNNDRVLRWIKK